MRSLCFFAFFCLILFSCKDRDPSSSDRFSTSPERFPVQPGQVDEASGIVDSRTINGHVWVQQDSDTPAEICLMSHQGKVVSRIPLPGIVNRDWEDLAVGPGPQAGVSYLYMADIGDNNSQYDVKFIYRFPEPKKPNESISSIERISFRYPDGKRDAEAILLDPTTKDIYIVSKWEAKVRLYRLPYPQTTNDIMQAEYNGEIPLSLVTGGSISTDGTEILIRTYTGANHWRRSNGQSVADALQRNTSRSLSVELEPQGEAIGFDKDGRGFFTLSEKRNAESVTLNYYKRL